MGKEREGKWGKKEKENGEKQERAFKNVIKKEKKKKYIGKNLVTTHFQQNFCLM